MTELATTQCTVGLQQDEKSRMATTRSVKLRQHRVLTLGDGNFSYSLALAKQYKNRRNEISLQLTATSYDSYNELITKYPDSKRICAQLKEMGALVLHRVDATNVRESLVAAGAEQLQFDSIVFNHPHCGEENVRRHQSLLSHFYASALEVLQDDEEDNESGIRLTLAEGQQERWQAVDRGLKAGLRLYRQIDDVDNDEVFGLVYERKRHQNAKSFHQVTIHGERKKQMSTLFLFRRQDSKSAASAKLATILPEIDQIPIISRKRKAESEFPLEFACTECERSFKCAQGLRTHIHMVHHLQGAAIGKVLLSCEICGRTFKEEDARRQHQVAKHGKDRLIQPDWYNKQKIATPSAAKKVLPSTTIISSLNCTICHFSFSTTEELSAHWQKLQPRIAGKRKCAICSREFDEDRALRQHQNFCG